MIKKILLSLVLICLFIAIPLAIMGITHVELGKPFMAFLQNVNRELNDFKIEIPNIPNIEPIQNGFVDAITGFINGLTSLINVLISVLNAIISLLQYLFLIIKNLFTFKDSLIETATM